MTSFASSLLLLLACCYFFQSLSHPFAGTQKTFDVGRPLLTPLPFLFLSNFPPLICFRSSSSGPLAVSKSPPESAPKSSCLSAFAVLHNRFLTPAYFPPATLWLTCIRTHPFYGAGCYDLPFSGPATLGCPGFRTMKLLTPVFPRVLLRTLTLTPVRPPVGIVFSFCPRALR